MAILGPVANNAKGEDVQNEVPSGVIEQRLETLLGFRQRALEIGYSLASTVVPNLVSTTTTAEQAAEITTLYARTVARKYQADLQAGLASLKTVKE